MKRYIIEMLDKYNEVILYFADGSSEVYGKYELANDYDAYDNNLIELRHQRAFDNDLNYYYDLIDLSKVVRASVLMKPNS
ncbi:hypothetical protein [Streptococcus anginosus]|uniref:hypothetical protein n=1 Tax=Streptococcus anginosus TaxID=1328 RepID=UPI001248387A|nr:hypothetical protein [Streptococcus anginosus]KAA9306647.1 hypothetical protein F6I00_03830 [Streptococcus anginosus]KAB0647479.1 hypothetical protein F6I01_01865 [Aerococcus sanguinicola]MCW0997732.1 hypothetical protein [Streptococcus anginosus]